MGWFLININHEIFKINRRIDVIIPNHESAGQQYSSRIEDVTSDHMVIAMPMSKGMPVMILHGEVFSGRVVADDVVYEFTSSLIAKQLWPLPVWTIVPPYDVKRVQKRAFVRLDAALPVQIIEIVNGKAAKSTVTNAVTRDFSGGGMQVVVTRVWPLGAKLMVTVQYPDIGSITHISEVVRVQQPQADLKVYWEGLKFLEISERDRGNIIKLIFKKHLELRRKGLE